MDEGNPLYLNKTPKQILGEMGIRIDSELQISEKYDEFILAWMADIYTYMQWKYAIPSENRRKDSSRRSLQNITHCTKHQSKMQWIS